VSEKREGFKVAIPTGLGAIIAIVVLILAIVLAVIGQLPMPIAGLIAALAVARLC
jgi:uncharacterized membrane protein YhhN